MKPEEYKPERYSPFDIVEISAVVKLPAGPDGWREIDRKWEAHERDEIGPPTTPGEFAMRFLHDWTRAPIGEAVFATDDAEAIYLALREAFYEAMSYEVKVHAGPDKRSFK